MRHRFDRAKAWVKYQAYIKSPEPDEQDGFDMVAERLYQQKHALRQLAYGEIDEIVEIGTRQVFAKMGDPDMMDDLRQAARLRLYQFMPKMATFCLNDEHYFRLCLSAVRWAALSEYSRLKRQSKREVSNETSEGEDVDSGVDWSSLEHANDIAVPDEKFERLEDMMLANQAVCNIAEAARRRLTKIYPSLNERSASFLVLNSALRGKEIADTVLRYFGVINPKDLQQVVKITIRDAVKDQRRK